MKSKLLILIFVMFLVTVGVALAQSGTLIFSDDFDDNSINTSKWTESDSCGLITEAGGELKLYRQNTGGAGDTCNSPSTSTLLGKFELGTNISLRGKVKVLDQYAGVGGFQSTSYFIFKDGNNGVGAGPFSQSASSFRATNLIREGGVNENNVAVGTYPSWNTWVNFSMTLYDNNSYFVCLDNVCESSTYTYGSDGFFGFKADDDTNPSTLDYDVRFDDIEIYNLSVTTVSNFSVTAKDIYDSSSISNFSITIDGTNYTTTTGTITTHILDNDTSTYTIDFFNATNSKGAYFNKTVTGIDVTAGTYSDNLTQSLVNLQALEIITNNSLTGTFKVNGSNLGSSQIPLKAGLYNFSFTNSSYYQKDLLYNVPALFNDTVNITDVYSSVLNLSVFNAYTGAPISNFTGWISSSILSFNESISSSSASKLLYLINSNYTVYVESENYAVNDSSNSGTININESEEALNLSIWTKNSIRITLREEADNSLITENISLVITGNNSEDTYYSTTGAFYLENLTDGEYSLKFDGDNFTTRVYTVTVADRSTQTLTAYLTRATETVIFSFTDSLSSSAIELVSITMYRQINSTWTVIESKYSDITGRAQFTYTPSVKYKFYATKTGYTSKEFTLDPILFSSYTIQLDKVQVSTVDQTQTISFGFTPKVFSNNEINNLTFYISSTTGSLQLYGINISYPGGTNTFNGTNANGESQSFSLNITGATLLSTVDITVYYDTVLGDLVTKKYSYLILNASNSGTFYDNSHNDYGLGDLEKVFIAVLIIVIVAGLGTMIGGGLIGGVLGLIMAGIFSYMGFIPVLSLILVVVVGFVLISRRSSE